MDDESGWAAESVSVVLVPEGTVGKCLSQSVSHARSSGFSKIDCHLN